MRQSNVVLKNVFTARVVQRRHIRFTDRETRSRSFYWVLPAGDFFCLGLWRCYIAVPGNLECAVESRWLPREKQITVLVIAVIGDRIEVLRIHGNNMIDQKIGVL